MTGSIYVFLAEKERIMDIGTGKMRRFQRR